MRNSLKSTFALLIISSSVILSSCQKDNVENLHLKNEHYVSSERDHEFSMIAKSLATSLYHSHEMRQLLKDEALKMYDGDYDVQFYSVIEQDILVSNDKKGVKTVNFGNLLWETLTNSPEYAKKSDKLSWDEYLDKLKQKYPGLQFSVPVHAEDWKTGILKITCLM